MKISNFVAYIKQIWYNRPTTSTPLEAGRLNHIEDGIKKNSDAIEQIAAAVISQIVNDPNKIASMAALYPVNQNLTKLNSDFTNLKKTDLTLTKDVASLILKVTDRTYTRIMKNANSQGIDYATNITDVTNGQKTEVTIQNGGMKVNGFDVAKINGLTSVSNSVSFDSIGLTKESNGKYKLHFYKNGGWVASIGGGP